MRTPRWVPWVYLGPAVAVMAVACLVPLLSALQLGFYDWSMGTPWSEAKWVGPTPSSRPSRTRRCGVRWSPR
jgi:multiple sugar transport system permease protein